MGTWSVLLAVAAITIAYIICSYLYAPFRTLQLLRRCGINGPRPIPFFGNFLQMKKLGALKLYDQLYKRYGPVCVAYVGFTAEITIADLDILKQVLVKEFDSFMDRRPYGNPLTEGTDIPNGLSNAMGEDWKRARKTLSPTFSTTKMKMMLPLVQKSCNILVEKLGPFAGGKNSVEIFRAYGSFTMETIVAIAFGRFVNLQKGEQTELTEAARNIFAGAREGQTSSLQTVEFVSLNFPFLRPLIRLLLLRSKVGAALNVLREIAINLVRARRETAGESKYKDLLQLMIDACPDEDSPQESGRRLTDKEIVAHSIIFLLAGYESTATTLSYASYLLALHPTVQDRLYTEIQEYFQSNPEASMYDATQDLQYLDMVLQETLRLYPPVVRAVRFCQKTTKIDDNITIPKGSMVRIPIHLLHYDAKFWPDPEKFNPERFTPEERAKRPQMCHMPFGWGPRNCIAMRFALMEAKMVLINILRKYKFVQAPDTEVPLQTVLGITMSPKNGIYLRIATRD